MRFPVVLTIDEDGKYTAEVPVIPGCISCGDTKNEALQNVKDAIRLCLKSQREEGWQLPKRYSIEHVEVVAA